MGRITKARHWVFIRDVFVLSLTSFGGPQAHIGMFLNYFCERRRYLTESELMELFALCQILPGPSSTQLITAVGYKRGGVVLGLITLLVWMLPAVTIMTGLAVIAVNFREAGLDMRFARFVQPMGIGVVALAAFRLLRQLHTRVSIVVAVVSACVAFIFRSPYVLPLVLVFGGAVASYRYRDHKRIPQKKPINVRWGWLVALFVVFGLLAGLGGLTRALPVRLMENFYRNGLLVFGGGQVLISILYTEFVQFKKYLTADEFLTGWSIAQAVPGPVFAFTSYISVLAMKPYGLAGEILGGLAGTVIFLPGTFVIFFAVRFWEQLKQFRAIRASIEGINAASTGLVIAAVGLLGGAMDKTWTELGIVAATVTLLSWGKIPAYVLILLGLAVGYFIR